MSSVFSLLQSLLSDPFLTSGFGLGPSKTGPRMVWKETPEAHIFKFDLPGRTKDDVKLQVHDDKVLHVSADIKDQEDYYNGEKGNNKFKWHCKERLNSGSFCREFKLPENALVDEKKINHVDKKNAVEIEGGDDPGSSVKGLGRFVCCKA